MLTYPFRAVALTIVALSLWIARPALGQPAAPPSDVPLKQFTASDKANPRLARQLAIPPFFALPASARATVPSQIPTTDILVDFKHPDAKGGDVGLRVVETARAGHV